MERATEFEYQAAEGSSTCRGTCKLQRNCRPISGWRQEIQAEYCDRTFKALRSSRGEIPREIKTFKSSCGEFPGSPVVRTPCFHCWGLDSVPDQGTEIPRATRCGKIFVCFSIYSSGNSRYLTYFNMTNQPWSFSCVWK